MLCGGFWSAQRAVLKTVGLLRLGGSTPSRRANAYKVYVPEGQAYGYSLAIEALTARKDEQYVVLGVTVAWEIVTFSV